MSKKNRERRDGDARPEGSGNGGGGAAPSWLPLVMAVAALAISVFVWVDAKNAAQELKKVEEKVTVLTTQLANVQNRPAQQQPRASGPDPAKVYPINIAGSPTKGNPNASIVIAEFSEYQ